MAHFIELHSHEETLLRAAQMSNQRGASTYTSLPLLLNNEQNSHSQKFFRLADGTLRIDFLASPVNLLLHKLFIFS